MARRPRERKRTRPRRGYELFRRFVAHGAMPATAARMIGYTEPVLNRHQRRALKAIRRT